MVVDEPDPATISCARLPANVCVLGERSHDRKNLVFSALDPVKGRGREITRLDVDPTVESYYWDLAPDGSRIAVIIPDNQEGHIRVVTLGGETGAAAVRDVIVKGWPALQHLNWTNDGKGWYTSNNGVRGGSLLHVDLEGRASVMRQEPNPQWWGIWGLTSLDGRYLAFPDYSSTANVWMIENF
jgi:hypothetical protein